MMFVIVVIIVVVTLLLTAWFNATKEGFFTQTQTHFDPTWKHSIAWNTCFENDSLLDSNTRYVACKEAATETDMSTIQYHIVRGLKGLGYIAPPAPAPAPAPKVTQTVPPVAPTSSAQNTAPAVCANGSIHYQGDPTKCVKPHEYCFKDTTTFYTNQDGECKVHSCKFPYRRVTELSGKKACWPQGNSTTQQLLDHNARYGIEN